MLMKLIAILAAALLLFTQLPVAYASAEGMPSAAEGGSATGRNTDDDIILQAADGFVSNTDTAPSVGSYKDNDRQVSALNMPEESAAKWTFPVAKAGKYYVRIHYLPLEGKSNDIELDLKVNGAYLSDALDMVTLKRVWTSDGDPIVDSAGNQRRPAQKEAGIFNTYTVRGSLENEFAAVELKAGENTLEIMVTREAVAIETVTFIPADYLPDYADYISQYGESDEQHEGYVYFEAESARYKSDNTLYALNDRSSSITSPSHYYKTLLNTMGGNNWRYADQWIEWDFHVETAGLYQIGMRARQNYRQGQNTSRKIYIDGEVPFKEFESVAFPYSTKWQNFVLGDGENPCLVYLTAGDHTLRMEYTIGAVSEVLEKTNTLVQQLNEVYRSILVFLGNTPDPNRDYQLDVLLPDLMGDFQKNLDLVVEIKEELLAVTGEKGEDYAQFDELDRQIRRFMADYDKIPAQFDTFRTNISSLSEWLLTAQEQPILIDYFEVSAPGYTAKKADAGFFSQLWFGIKAFFASFFMDYSSVSDAGDAEETVTLWMASTGTAATGTAVTTMTGRDQAEALTNLIDNSFTPKTGISVNLKLVDINSLIPAVATGNGPDVTLTMASKTVMDYGFRGALYDLSEFEDYEEVLKSFSPEAAVPFQFGGSLYALPETFTFNLMFYRKDILNDLNLEVPETWDDMRKLLPELNNNFLTLGLPNLTSNDNIEIYTTLLYQKGAEAYDEEAKKSLFATDEGIQAFEEWADFYSKYKVPQKMDQLTYFRTGEAPIIIAPYTFYNNLAAGAPEIEGLWGAALVPGTKREDGTVDHTVMSNSSGAVMFKNAKNPKNAWEFLKWWTSEDCQYQYGMEIETVMGAAGRIATANLKAFERLPWTKEAVEIIGEQMGYAKALPEVPGGYMSSRYIPTAMRLVVNNSVFPRDALIDYSSLIDQEITTKRKEFHLD